MRERLRPVAAAVLAIALPGLGHVLLKRWGRALVWHGTIVGGAILLFALYDVEPVDPLSTPSELSAAVPAEVSVPIAFLVGLSAVDAYLVGREDVVSAARAVATANAVRRQGAGNSGDPNSAERPEGGTMERSTVTGEGTATNDDGSVAAQLAAGTIPDVKSDGEGPAQVQCPNCGRETDAEIDFCHWCTEPLPWAESE